MNVGHNSKKTRVGGVAADQLRSIVTRIEKLEEEKAALGADIRDIYAEARGNGYCTTALRQIIKLRKQDASERDEQEAILDVYLRSLGMRPQLDMFDAGQGA